MQNVNIHKQRLIAIAISVLGLIFLFLPWIKVGTSSHMGYGIWGGIASALAFAGVIVDCILLGDKTKAFDKQGKMIAMIAFGFALLLTLIIALTASGTGQETNGFFIIEVKKSSGIGVWLTLVLEIIGLLWVSGLVDQLLQPKTVAAGTTPPPPPPSPK